MSYDPTTKTDLGVCMSNCDHSIEEGAAATLLAAGTDSYMTYPGRDFLGYVWSDGLVLHCSVWQWGREVGTITADTLRGIMHDVSDEYGYE